MCEIERNVPPGSRCCLCALRINPFMQARSYSQFEKMNQVDMHPLSIKKEKDLLWKSVFRKFPSLSSWIYFKYLHTSKCW
jgi:hypothetical protein